MIRETFLYIPLNSFPMLDIKFIRENPGILRKNFDKKKEEKEGGRN